jgi:hypothetical protein
VYNLNAAAVQLATVAPNSSSDSNVPAAQLVLTNRVYDDLTERGQIIYNSDGSSHLAEAYDAKLQQLHSVAESTDDVVYMLPNISSMYYKQPRCSRSALGCQKLKALPLPVLTVTDPKQRLRLGHMYQQYFDSYVVHELPSGSKATFNVVLDYDADVQSTCSGRQHEYVTPECLSWLQQKGLALITMQETVPIIVKFQAIRGTVRFPESAMYIGEVYAGMLPVQRTLALVSTLSSSASLEQLSISNGVSSSVAELAVSMTAAEWRVPKLNKYKQIKLKSSKLQVVGSVTASFSDSSNDMWHGIEVHMLDVAAKHGDHASCYSIVNGSVYVLEQCVDDSSVTLPQLDFHNTLKFLRYCYSADSTALVKSSEVRAHKALQRSFKHMQALQLLKLSGTVTAVTTVSNAVTNSVLVTADVVVPALHTGSAYFDPVPQAAASLGYVTVTNPVNTAITVTLVLAEAMLGEVVQHFSLQEDSIVAATLQAHETVKLGPIYYMPQQCSLSSEQHTASVYLRSNATLLEPVALMGTCTGLLSEEDAELAFMDALVDEELMY